MKRWVAAHVWFSVVLLLCSCTGNRAQSSFRVTPPNIIGTQNVCQYPQPGAEIVAELRLELKAALRMRGIELDADWQVIGKRAAATPKTQYEAPLRNDDVLTGNSDLYWMHFMDGDYDSNGEVNINDLTPLAAFLGINSSAPNWGTDAHVADGDGNGEVNISDLTSIAANFGAGIGGYAIEAREAAGEWRDYGFMDFNSGFPSSNTLEFGYSCNGGMVEAEFRVRPVGPVRDFDWVIYQLTDSAETESHCELGTVDGRPMITYLSADQSMASYLGFAVSSTERPMSAADWYIEHMFLAGMDSDLCPAPVSIQGRPALSYLRLDPGGATESLYFNLRGSGNAGPDSWSEHLITGPAPSSFPTATVVREGRPAVFYDGNGLKMFQAAISFPSSSTDWNGIDCNPSFNDFSYPSVVSSGPYLFACGTTGTPSPALIYSHTLGPGVSGPSDFSEFLLWPDIDINVPSPLLLIGGIPCIATSDQSQSQLQFIMAPTRDVNSSSNWFLHSVVSSPGLDDYWYPTMALIEGRPAICSGYGVKYFHWTGGQWPDSPDDWHHQGIDPAIQNQFVRIVSAGGLPVLSYSHSAGGGPSDIMIAVAVEQ